MCPLFCGLSLAAGDSWSVNHFPTAPHHALLLCVYACVVCVRCSESWAWGWREEGTCSERMVICAEEVMESGHHWPRPPTRAFTTTKHAYFIPWQSHCYKEYDKKSKNSLGTLLILNKDRSVCAICCYWRSTSYCITTLWIQTIPRHAAVGL